VIKRKQQVMIDVHSVQRIKATKPLSKLDPQQRKLEKREDEIKIKSSPLKLLSQSQPNFAEMILGWSSSKIVSGISEYRAVIEYCIISQYRVAIGYCIISE
jgi:hypothetical protein